MEPPWPIRTLRDLRFPEFSDGKAWSLNEGNDCSRISAARVSVSTTSSFDLQRWDRFRYSQTYELEVDITAAAGGCRFWYLNGQVSPVEMLWYSPSV